MSHVCRSAARAAVLAVLLSLTVGASTAMAFHIPGAVYVGTHSGGGTVSFRVALDGTTIRSFEVDDYDTDFCGEVESLRHLSSVTIFNNAFSFSSSSLGFRYSGAFPSVQRAQGTFVDTECDSGTLTWTAKTTASPVSSAECIAAQGPAAEAEALVAAATAKANRKKTAYRKSVKRAKKAKRAVKRAKKPKAKRRARNGLRRAVKQQKRGQRELRQARTALSAASTQLAAAVAAKSAVCDPVP